EQLEAKANLDAPTLIRIGWVAPLPKDYVGEKHVALSRLDPISPGKPSIQWFIGKEVPGPAPLGTRVLDDDLSPFGPGAVADETVEADARNPSDSNQLSDEVGLELETEE
ncbi:MAG: hypothetical protein WBW33_07680, partial [Bryobacteraceae bacterium]